MATARSPIVSGGATFQTKNKSSIKQYKISRASYFTYCTDMKSKSKLLMSSQVAGVLKGPSVLFPVGIF